MDQVVVMIEKFHDAPSFDMEYVVPDSGVGVVRAITVIVACLVTYWLRKRSGL